MKKRIQIYPVFLLILALFLLWACQKTAVIYPSSLSSDHIHMGYDTSHIAIITSDSQYIPPALPKAPFPQQAPVNACLLAPIYGDTIIYPQPTSGSDYIMNVVNSPGAGKYLSWPVGMVIDSVSGAIDVTASQTGLQYAVGFVKNGTTDTCLQTLVIGGASYADSVYVISEGQTTAVPYFEGNPTLLNTCATGNGCSFDVTGSAAKMGVIVNSATGDINLQQTLNGTGLLPLGGAFGLLPTNGSSVTTSIYYKLNDPSNYALQNIQVQLVYYDKESLINSGLLNTVLNKLNNLLSGHLIDEGTNPRPPLIVIVRSM
jgi:hypothetical protein